MLEDLHFYVGNHIMLFSVWNQLVLYKDPPPLTSLKSDMIQKIQNHAQLPNLEESQVQKVCLVLDKKRMLKINWTAICLKSNFSENLRLG